jgi:starch synthase
MRILFVSSEMYPYAKKGGLGDVSAALPAALYKKGADVRLLLPGHPGVLERLKDAKTIRTVPRFFGAEKAEILLGTLPDGLMAYVISAPHLYSRAGLYVDEEDGQDWADNHLRFAALSRVAADLYYYDAEWPADIVHCNDWQSGLAPAYLSWRGQPRPATVFTIHNLAYQGLFPKEHLASLMLPQESFRPDGVEFYDQIGFLKAGLYYADNVTTVSPTYAAEIQTPGYGCGLEGLLQVRGNKLSGILNGIDRGVWDPAVDPHIAKNYDSDSLKDRKHNKKALLAEFGLMKTRLTDPVFAVVSRLTHQKGLDLLLDALPTLLADGLRLIVHGTGERAIEEKFLALANAWPQQVAVKIGFDEILSHRIQAGADAVLVPSRFEPCGLVQLYALRYGALPIVRKTGGLADTVVDGGLDGTIVGATGFTFNHETAEDLKDALSRAMNTYSQPAQWAVMQRNAMMQDFGWARAATQYMRLYRSLAPEADPVASAGSKGKPVAPIPAGLILPIRPRATQKPSGSLKQKKAGTSAGASLALN